MNGKSKLTRALFQRLQQSVLIGTIVLGGYMTPSLASAAQQLPKVPTTKIIAIGSLTATATPEAVSAVLPEEVRETVKLSLAGKIEQWNVRTDKSGVVFVLNVTDVAEARDMFAKMPLDRAGLMTFEFIPVGPLSPLALLLEQPAR